MKLIVKLSRVICVLLSVIFSIGCGNNKEQEHLAKDCLITGINTEGFKVGDILVIGEFGKLVAANPEDELHTVGVVVGNDSIQLYNFDRHDWVVKTLDINKR